MRTSRLFVLVAIAMLAALVLATAQVASAIDTHVDAFPSTGVKGAETTFNFRVYGDPGTECVCVAVVERARGKAGTVATIPLGTYTPADAMQSASVPTTLKPGAYHWYVEVTNRAATYASDALRVTNR